MKMMSISLFSECNIHSLHIRNSLHQLNGFFFTYICILNTNNSDRDKNAFTQSLSVVSSPYSSGSKISGGPV